MERCIRPCSAWKRRNGLARNGVCRRTIARRDSTRCPPKAASTCSRKPAAGARWPRPWRAFSISKNWNPWLPGWRVNTMFDRRRRPESDFSEELQAHLALEIDRLRASGQSEEQAQRTARRNLGNLTAAGERFYDSSRWLWL